MGDLVQRLRKRGHLLSDGAGGSDGSYRPQTFRVDALCAEAADEIVRLRAALAAALVKLHAAEIEEVEAAIERGDYLGEPVTAAELKREIRGAAALATAVEGGAGNAE